MVGESFEIYTSQMARMAFNLSTVVAPGNAPRLKNSLLYAGEPEEKGLLAREISLKSYMDSSLESSWWRFELHTPGGQGAQSLEKFEFLTFWTDENCISSA